MCKSYFFKIKDSDILFSAVLVNMSVTPMPTLGRLYLFLTWARSYSREERQEDQSSPVYNSQICVCLILNSVCFTVGIGLQLISVNKPLITACNGFAVDCWGYAAELERWVLMNTKTEQTETKKCFSFWRTEYFSLLCDLVHALLKLPHCFLRFFRQQLYCYRIVIMQRRFYLCESEGRGITLVR